VPLGEEVGITKGIVYCTINKVKEPLLSICRNKLNEIANSMGIEVVSVSRKKIDFGNNITADIPRGKVAIIRKQIIGLENIKADYVFFCDDDVLYNRTHFDFIPPHDAFYFNQNIWFLDIKTGDTMFFFVKNGSAQSAYRESALEYLNLYLSQLYLEKKCICELSSKFGRKVDVYNSWYPIIDIKHDSNNSTKSFDRDVISRVIKPLHGWSRASGIPHWGKSSDKPIEFLRECSAWK